MAAAMVMAQTIKMRIAFPSLQASRSAETQALWTSCIEYQTNSCCCHGATTIKTAWPVRSHLQSSVNSWVTTMGRSALRRNSTQLSLLTYLNGTSRENCYDQDRRYSSAEESLTSQCVASRCTCDGLLIRVVVDECRNQTQPGYSYCLARKPVNAGSSCQCPCRPCPSCRRSDRARMMAVKRGPSPDSRSFIACTLPTLGLCLNKMRCKMD